MSWDRIMKMKKKKTLFIGNRNMFFVVPVKIYIVCILIYKLANKWVQWKICKIFSKLFGYAPGPGQLTVIVFL